MPCSSSGWLWPSADIDFLGRENYTETMANHEDPTAYVLMTAMPPTIGHMALIRFASNYMRDLRGNVEVHLQTQPDEPHAGQRQLALVRAVRNARLGNVTVHRMHKTLPQEPDPATEAKFWGMWVGFLEEWGVKPGDYIIASEGYGLELAKRLEGVTFVPFDVKREVVNVRATDIRINMDDHFSEIIPEFQRFLRKRVTFFGAESTGKTTLSKQVQQELQVLNNGNGVVWTPEWARPYLELCGPEVTVEGMHTIWHGQRALQELASAEADRKNAPYILQDTDLWSTVGFWELPAATAMWQSGAKGAEVDTKVPNDLYRDAMLTESDLYIVCPSNIPFEADPLRYGGDKRESADQYWIDLLEREKLNYVVLEETNLFARAEEATEHIYNLFMQEAEDLSYTRSAQLDVPFPAGV